MSWYSYERELWHNQKLPKERKYVLVEVESSGPPYPNAIMLGYIKYAAGEKDSPGFVVVGNSIGKVLRWTDSALNNFVWPKVFDMRKISIWNQL